MSLLCIFQCEVIEEFDKILFVAAIQASCAEKARIKKVLTNYLTDDKIIKSSLNDGKKNIDP